MSIKSRQHRPLAVAVAPGFGHPWPGMMIALTVPIGALLGFFLPGYVIARKLWPAARFETGFLLSCLILFFTFLAFNAAGARLRFLPVAAVLAGLTLILSLALWRVRVPMSPRLVVPQYSWLMLAAIALVVAVLVLRAAVSPLTGYDTPWRWDRLAVQMAGLGHFRFYPPLNDYDFRHYFYCDGFPPLVSVCYAWLYLSAGLHLIGLTAVVVVAEFVAALLFVARAGAVLTGSPRGGALAGVLFAGCPMAFWWTAIGQETGMLVLSAAAILYFLSAAGEGAGIAAAVLAGGAAGLAALAREYGPAFVVLGLVACAWLRVGWRRSAVFAAVAVVLAAPWYARVDALTGNPIWSNRFLGLPVNAVHAAIMDYYTTVFSPRLWSARDWMSVIGTVFLGAPLVLPLGMAAGLSRFPRRGFLLIFAAGVIALFLWSASYTAGGKDYAVRVATPALVPLAILAAALLDRTPPSTATGLAVAAAVFTALWCWALPFTPAQVRSQSSRSAVAAYLQAGFQRVPSLGVDARVVAGIRTRVPKGGMVLTDSMYLPQFLDSLGIRTAPVWRPDLAFLFDRSLPLQEAFRKLRAAGITHIVYRPFVPPGPYLQRFAAFSPEADRTVWLTELDVIINVP